jgi:hypothetical protein
MTSGTDEFSPVAQKWLVQSMGRLRQDSDYWTITHVETKYAVYMRQKGITNANVVINHVKGPCAGMYGCRTTVEQILPKGYTMTVYYPNSEPVVLKGRVEVP